MYFAVIISKVLTCLLSTNAAAAIVLTDTCRLSKHCCGSVSWGEFGKRSRFAQEARSNERACHEHGVITTSGPLLIGLAGHYDVMYRSNCPDSDAGFLDQPYCYHKRTSWSRRGKGMSPSARDEPRNTRPRKFCDPVKFCRP